VHVSAEPATGLITDEQLTRPAGPDNSDAAVAARMIVREAEAAQVYGDSAYGTGVSPSLRSPRKTLPTPWGEP
jgi:hypothetical protein